MSQHDLAVAFQVPQSNDKCAQISEDGSASATLCKGKPSIGGGCHQPLGPTPNGCSVYSNVSSCCPGTASRATRLLQQGLLQFGAQPGTTHHTWWGPLCNQASANHVILTATVHSSNQQQLNTNIQRPSNSIQTPQANTSASLFHGLLNASPCQVISNPGNVTGAALITAPPVPKSPWHIRPSRASALPGSSTNANRQQAGTRHSKGGVTCGRVVYIAHNRMSPRPMLPAPVGQ